MAAKKKAKKNKPKATKKFKPLVAKSKAKPKPKIKKSKKDNKKVVKKVLKPKKISKIKKSVKIKKIYKPVTKKSVVSKTKFKRYDDKDLAEFRKLINEKLAFQRKEMKNLQEQITRKDGHGTDDTENRFVNMEDGTSTMEREFLNQMAARTHQIIDHLEKALQRIENKTYGICRVTGKLIPKERLRVVPHATLSIEGKKALAKDRPQVQSTIQPEISEEKGEQEEG